MSKFVKAGMTDLYDNPPELSDVLDAQRVLNVRLAVEHEDVARLAYAVGPAPPCRYS